MPCLRKGKKYYNNLRFFKRFVSIKKDQSNIEGLIQICKRPCLNIYLLIKHENPFFYPNFLVVHLAEGLIITYLSTSTEVFSTILHVLYFLEIYSIIKIFTIVSLLREQMIRAFLWLWQCTDCDYPCNRYTT